MPCLLTLIALSAPRLVVALLWLFSNWFTGLFSTSLMVLLGFIFLPTTLLWYTCVQHWFGGQWTFWPIVGMVLALCADFSPAAGRKKE
jgi:hypothetical protein